MRGQRAMLPIGPPGQFRFPVRASVSIETNPCRLDMRSGVVVGDLVIVRESHCERLHKILHDRIIIV